MISRIRNAHREVVCITALACLTSAPAAAQAPAEAERIAGCYDVFVGAWAPEAPRDSIYFAPPTRIRLSTDTAHGFSGRPVGYAAEPAPGALPSVHDFSRWTLSGNTVIISWTTGLAGVGMRLTGSDTLRGTARTGTDVPGSQVYTAPVSAPRIDCDAPLDEARSLSYRYPRSVRFADGDSLILEGTVDSSRVLTRPTRGSVIARGTPLAPYEDASRVEVWTREDGTIRSLRIHYPDGVEFDQLLAHLTEAFGAPTSRRESPGPAASWSSRLLYISLSNGLSRDPGLRVTINSHRRFTTPPWAGQE